MNVVVGKLNFRGWLLVKWLKFLMRFNKPQYVFKVCSYMNGYLRSINAYEKGCAEYFFDQVRPILKKRGFKNA